MFMLKLEENKKISVLHPIYIPRGKRGYNSSERHVYGGSEIRWFFKTLNRDCVFVFARLFINPTGNTEKEISSSHTCPAYIWECIVCLFRRRFNTSALYYIKIPISLLCAELAGFNNKIRKKKKKKKIGSINFEARHHEISNFSPPSMRPSDVRSKIVDRFHHRVLIWNILDANLLFISN